MFRKSKREKRNTSFTSIPESIDSGNVPTKRHSKLFSFGKKDKKKNSSVVFDELESPESDGIRIEEYFQNKLSNKNSLSSIPASPSQIQQPLAPGHLNENKAHTIEKNTNVEKVASKTDKFLASKNASLPQTGSGFNRKLSGSSSLNFDFGTDTSLTFQNFTADVLRATEEKLNGVELKLPELKQSTTKNNSRTIHVNRTSAGDFGIVLRRTSTKKGNNRVIHLVEPTSENASVGLLPGDHLIAVDGVNVENRSREDIIGMIASVSSVSLTVAPVPELSELSSRTAAIQNVAPQKVPSLARSGSVRNKMKSNKSDKDLAVEKSWLLAGQVWFTHANGYSIGRLFKEKNADNEVVKHQLKLDQGSETIEVEEHEVEMVNPPAFDQAEDLSTLSYLNESSCIHTLRQRYAANLPHTFAGSNLIIIKPKSKLEVYTTQVMHMFRGCKQEDMPPHIYAVAQTTYRNMLATTANQSIVFWGNAGAGKTFNFRQVLRYFSMFTSPENNKIALQLNSALSMIEAMQNTSSKLSANASCGRNLVTLDFDSSGLLVGGNFQNFFLGKSLFTHDTESSYKIFYYLLEGCQGKLRNDLFLDYLPKKNNVLVNVDGQSHSIEFNSSCWTDLLGCMDILNITEEEAKGIWSPLAAILHLGAAGVTKVADSKTYFSNVVSAQHAAAILGTTEENLARIIFTGTMQQSGQHSRSNSTRSRSNSSLGKDDLLKRNNSFSSAVHSLGSNSDLLYDLSVSSLEGFAYGLYMESYSGMLRLINRCFNATCRLMSKIHVLDTPGFQNPSQLGMSADLNDLCMNYSCEKLQWLAHFCNFTQIIERYHRENIDCRFDPDSISPPGSVLAVIDKVTAERKVSRSNLHDEKGLFWIIEEEALRSSSNEVLLVEKISLQHSSSNKGIVITDNNFPESFIIRHYHNTVQVKYNTSGWLKRVRDHPATKMTYGVLMESNKPFIAELYSGQPSGVFQTSTVQGGRRRTHNMMTSTRKNTMSMQVKLQMDKILELLERTRVSFVYCFLPDKLDGSADPLHPSKDSVVKDTPVLDVPFVRQQLRSSYLMESMRLYKQGFPAHLPYSEFRRRFDMLLKKDERHLGPVLDEKQAVVTMVKQLDLDERSNKLGLSQIFFRVAALARLEDARDDLLSITITEFQALCRGCLARKRIKHLKVQHLAVRCIQRNVRNFIQIRNWRWWRLYTKVLPLLDVHRTEHELKSKSTEVNVLKTRIESLLVSQSEQTDLHKHLQKKIQELNSQLNELQASSVHTNDLLDQEVAERNRMEEELETMKMDYEETIEQRDRLSKDLTNAQMNGHTVIYTEGIDEAELTDNDDIWRKKCKAMLHEHETLRRKMVEDHDDEIQQLSLQKRSTEKALAEERAEADELRRQLANNKRKINKFNAELDDMKLLLETGQCRNAELEKKQRKFDQAMNGLQESLEKEKAAKDGLFKDKERLLLEKHCLQVSFEQSHDEIASLNKKVAHLDEEIKEYTSAGKTDNESVMLKRQLRELNLKVQDQEEELDEQAGKIQQLEQVKLKLEMSIQRDKQQNKQELESKEEEILQLKADQQRKIRLIEEQLDEEAQTKTELQRAKREMERKVFELQSSVNDVDKSSERALRKELKKLRVLHKDAKTALSCQSSKSSDSSELKVLRNQLEDSDFTKHMALKAKAQMQVDCEELTNQIDELNKAKVAAEARCLSLSRDNADLLTRVDETDDEFKELIKKQKQLLSQVSEVEISLIVQRKRAECLQGENDSLSQSVDALMKKIESNRLTTVERTDVEKLQVELKESEGKMEIEMTSRIKLEHQVLRLKGHLERVQDEKNEVLSAHSRLQQNSTRLARQMKESQEELESFKRKEEDSKRRRNEFEDRLQVVEDELSHKKIELTNAEKRIRDLQESLEQTNSSEDDLLLDYESDDSVTSPPRRSSSSRFYRPSLLSDADLRRSSSRTSYANNRHNFGKTMS